MNVHESDARQIFADRGLPVPPSRVATTPDEAAAAAAEFGGLVVVKALVLAGGRGKAGGVKLADGADAARDAAQQISGWISEASACGACWWPPRWISIARSTWA